MKIFLLKFQDNNQKFQLKKKYQTLSTQNRTQNKNTPILNLLMPKKHNHHNPGHQLTEKINQYLKKVNIKNNIDTQKNPKPETILPQNSTTTPLIGKRNI